MVANYSSLKKASSEIYVKYKFEFVTYLTSSDNRIKTELCEKGLDIDQKLQYFMEILIFDTGTLHLCIPIPELVIN